MEFRHDYSRLWLAWFSAMRHPLYFTKTRNLVMRNWHFERSSRIAETLQVRQLAITETTTDLVATIDIDGFLTQLNRAGYTLLELDEKRDISELRMVGFYTSESAAAFFETEMPNAIGFGASQSEVNLVSMNGVVIPSSQVLIAHKDSWGNVECFFVILRDIRSIKEAESERLALKEQLHQSRKIETVGRLVGGIAHDFNNFTAVIMGHAELGLLNTASRESTKADLEIILDSAQKAARLTNQLLIFASKQAIKPQILNLNEVLQNSQLLINSIMGKEVSVDISTDQSLWAIKIDRSQLEQIILNLSMNSRDALDKAGTFSLSTENRHLTKMDADKLGLFKAGDYVKFIISDDGCGIEEGIIENIFDPFFTTKQQGKGTGLGLSAVYGAVKQNNGFIKVFSTVGVGTKFEIYFPRDDSNSQILQIAASADRTVEMMTVNESILLVEDNEAVSKLLSTILKNLGYKVVETSNGRQALEIFKINEDKFDLVISDVIMPIMNGIELCRELRSIEIPVKVLLISGHTDQIVSIAELVGSNVSFLRKPFPVQKFTEVVRDILDNVLQPGRASYP